MPALLPILSFIWSAATSRIGLLLLGAAAAYSYGHHRATISCGERIAAMHSQAVQAVIADQKHQVESRQKLDMWDSIRQADRGKTAADMQAEIDGLKAQLDKKDVPNAKASGCPKFDAGDFGRRVQRLDRSGGR